MEGESIDVLRGVDFTMERGDLIGVMGRSGAGKSTLLQVIGTLDRPTSGRVEFEGRDVFALSDRELSAFRNRTIGFVFQFHHLLPEFTTLENAAMPAIIARIPRAEANERASHYLERVGLGDRLRHRPGELSGGEQQRVALARALVMQPKLILADEPTGNLDDATGRAIFDLFLEVNAETGVTIVVVTHNLVLARSMQRQYMMRDGHLLPVEDEEEVVERLGAGEVGA
ncbi:MAG: ABC transporter ATP-binding protein [Deltaproteobacteria bacterium]|nr:MAG: ABC transporter ATP-binding protein [Deltaproteobacteria bacterium]